MKNKPPPRRRTISTVQRGQIVQRVIVDGWASDEVARAFAVPRRLVEVWVADYRRYGMASLRQDAGRTIVMDLLQGVWRPLRAMLHKILEPKPPVEPLPLRHSSKDGPR
jgi:hypothetical protein